MNAVDWINDTCPCVSEADTVAEALAQLQLPECRHEIALKCVDGSFGGFFAIHRLPTHPDLSALASVYCAYTGAHVVADASYYDLLRVSQRYQGMSVAVVDAEGGYMGTVSARDMVTGMAFFVALRSPGAVLVLRMRHEDYTLSELAQLVESNHMKILDTTLIQDAHTPHDIFVVLKLSGQDSAAVRATLARYGYSIVSYRSDSDKLQQQERENYEALMKYLGI